MRVRQGSGSVQLALMMALAGSWMGGWMFPAQASSLLQPVSEQREGDRPGLTPAPERTDGGKTGLQSITNIPRIHDQAQPATTVKDWVAQIEAATVQVTGVKLERTETGLDIVLETADGKPLQVDATRFRSEGDSLIADIPNAALVLPEGQTFTADNPTEEIATVQVVQRDENSIRVIVIGTNAVPQQEVTLRTGAFAYSLNPEDDEADDEIVVTGEGQRGYRVPNATTATKTDTPLRDVPQSIQVIPQQILQEQQPSRLTEALRNVPGVAQGANSSRSPFSNPLIRGFNTRNFLVDGLLDDTVPSAGYEPTTIDRIEVLKGPASVLFGTGSLGGTINLITKRPLREPYYSLEGSAGSFNLFRGAVDLAGPLNADKTVLYRLNAAAQTTESFVDFYRQERYAVAPTFSFQIGDRAKLTLAAEYFQFKAPFDSGLPAEGTILPNPNGRIPRNRFVNEPDLDFSDSVSYRIGYDFEYRFSDNWQLRSAFRASFFSFDRDLTFARALAANKRDLLRGNSTQDFNDKFYNFDTYVTGKFTTGNIQHQLVTGINLYRQDTSAINRTRNIASLNLFNPQYGSQPTGVATPFDYRVQNNLLGIYIQDQIALADNLKVLLGGRFDIATNNYLGIDPVTSTFQQDEVFSPRVGIVYQPIPAISLYASYSQSFQQAFTASPATGKPERGTQYEVGIKADITNRLSATLAFYDLTRTNLPTPDPNNPLLSILVGEQRSRGIEFDVTGEILPGWNMIAGYAYTDAEITKDNTFTVGNALNNVPRNSFNLWTTYEIQSGDFQGLGFGFGFFFVDERQGDLANTFQLPSYLRTDATIFYRRGGFRAGINFKNLFNVDYFESALNRNRVYYGDPFTVQGTISWQF